MIKIKLMLKEDRTRLLLLGLIEKIELKLQNNLDCSLYLMDTRLPNKLYKKIVFDKNTNINIRDEFQGTALTNTCSENKTLKVKLLLSHPRINVNLQDIDHYSALMYACMRGNALIVELLLQYPRIDINDTTESGSSPLLLARYHMLILKLLLQHPKIDVNIQNCVGETILMFACMGNKILLVKLLLQNPKIDVNLKNDMERTAIYYTKSKLIKLLIKSHPSYKGL